MANLGLGRDGKRRRQFFKQQDQAEQFINEHARTSFDPLHGRRNEVMFSLERVDRIGVSERGVGRGREELVWDCAVVVPTELYLFKIYREI